MLNNGVFLNKAQLFIIKKKEKKRGGHLSDVNRQDLEIIWLIVLSGSG